LTFLVLNQYRKGSGYKDVIGKLYHFPDRYLKAFSDLPSPFIYYEPREGGEQVYFGSGIVLSVNDDTEDVGHSYAEIDAYEGFHMMVDFYAEPNTGTWEPPKTMRNSVRRLPAELFNRILRAGGIEAISEKLTVPLESVPESLNRELASYPGQGKRAPYMLRRIRRILEAYERPSAITNFVKLVRGDTCQLCGTPGFLKRDGGRYCEVHHLFHLANDPPEGCLSPEYLVVLCATCHRRMHYAHVGVPGRTEGGWRLEIDGTEVLFKTDAVAGKTWLYQ
jgi:5-methylcytosine-specific restriction endonuclease McrA